MTTTKPHCDDCGREIIVGTGFTSGRWQCEPCRIVAEWNPPAVYHLNDVRDHTYNGDDDD
jgi:ribosomal protein L37AE/L43A